MACPDCDKALRLTEKRPAILARISPAQRDLLVFCQQRLPWGRASILIQDGEPRTAEIERETAAFGLKP